MFDLVLMCYLLCYIVIFDMFCVFLLIYMLVIRFRDYGSFNKVLGLGPVHALDLVRWYALDLVRW